MVAFDAAGEQQRAPVLLARHPEPRRTAPTGLTATAATGGVQLALGRPTDNIGVVGYIVYRATKTRNAGTRGRA